jgi:peptidoglycan/LPS O-acetylase OafA/YrhL
MIRHMNIGNKYIIDGPLKVIQVGGWIGVDLFFFLSGYLVTGLIINEYKIHGTFNPKRFLIRRGLKIYPTYYFFILYSFVFAYFIYGYRQSYTFVLRELFFVANYFPVNDIHLWSISVEEHFYFLLALLFFWLIKFKKINLKVIFYTYIILLITGLAFRLHTYFTYNQYDFLREYAGSHIRFDSLFFGVLVVYISNYRKDIVGRILSSKFNLLFILLSLVFLSSNFVFKIADYRLVSVINLALNPICIGYLFIHFINFDTKYFSKLISPFAYIGKYSYSIYLFHVSFMTIAGLLVMPATLIYYLLYFSMALLGGILISKSIEYPLISLREKYFPSLSTSIKLSSSYTKNINIKASST